MKRILFISSFVLPCYSGDAIYTYGNILRLSDIANVDLVSYNNTDFEKVDEYITLKSKINNLFLVNRPNKLSFFEKIRQLNIQDYSRAFEEELNKIIQTYSYDIIIIDHVRMAYTFEILKKSKLQNNSKIILVEHNVEYKNINEIILYHDDLFNKYKAKFKNYALKRIELKLIDKVDYVWFISKEDFQEINNQVINCGTKSNIITPYFPYEKIISNNDIDDVKYRLIITGSMSWYPNVDGVIWFIKNVFNKLIEIDSRFELYIVGNRPSDKIKNLESDKIIVTGKVPSIDDYLKMSDLLVVPNKLGSGVKIKVLEGILKGIPVIVSEESSKGYDEEIFSNGFIARTPEEFISIILNTIDNTEKKQEFIIKAQRYIAKENSRTEELIMEIINNITSK
jgi:glycosyltransferase involved in cell wall biosynthesis